MVCESSDVRKYLKKSKFQNFSEFFKVKGAGGLHQNSLEIDLIVVSGRRE